MALKGTLKDFGIADILQLIGQQQKTGVLYVKSKAEEVEVSFLNGNVVRAQSKTRKSKELLGAMLVDSGLVAQEDLDQALEVQRRTLKRLGDILVSEGKLLADDLSDLTQLQTTETLYKLFAWKNGTYEFVQQDVEPDPAAGRPIRPESVLMEGFRRIDEWPQVHRLIPSFSLAFERLRPLLTPALPKDARPEDIDRALDAALVVGAEAQEHAAGNVGPAEQQLYRLADPGLTVQRLIDLSRLGEFETCKALSNLVEAGYLATVTPKKVQPAAPARQRPRFGLATQLRRSAFQTGLGVLAVALVTVLADRLVPPPADPPAVPARTGVAERVLADDEIARLVSALEQSRLRHGHYPDSLDELVTDGLVDESDLTYPFRRAYYYRRTKDAYVLLPPL